MLGVRLGRVRGGASVPSYGDSASVDTYMPFANALFCISSMSITEDDEQVTITLSRLATRGGAAVA